MSEITQAEFRKWGNYIFFKSKNKKRMKRTVSQTPHLSHQLYDYKARTILILKYSQCNSEDIFRNFRQVSNGKSIHVLSEHYGDEKATTAC